MRITLHYGRTGLPLELPDDWDINVIRKPDMPVLPDPAQALAEALARPVASRPLSAIAEGCRTACILICDFTRPVPNGLILPALIKELMKAGLKPENITILVATGFHRPNLGDELRALVGNEWVMDTVAVVNHYARRSQDHIDLGRTRRGTPIKLDRRFVEADLRLVTGLVEPHFMAGYSGGRKVIVPGICHSDTITRIHSAEFLDDPKATSCVLEGNPLHLEQMEILDLLKPTFAVNAVIDDKRRLAYINFGEIAASHMEAVAFTRSYAEIPLQKRFRTVITTSAGHPLDATFYQTVKGMAAALGALEPGGRLFIASACSEGLGSSDFVESQTKLVRLGLDGFLKQYRQKPEADIDEWQTFMQTQALRRGSIRLYTGGLTDDEKSLTGVPLVESLEESIKEWVREIDNVSVAVIPEGPYVVPLS